MELFSKMFASVSISRYSSIALDWIRFMTIILFIRHGITTQLGKMVSGRMAGVHLNEVGRAQAERLSERLAHLGIDAIYSSPMERTMETAQPLSTRFDIPILTRKGLIEVDAGDWTGMTYDAVRATSEWKNYMQNPGLAKIPNGESISDVQSRVVAELEELRSQHRDNTIALFSHADVIKAALIFYVGIPIPSYQRLEIDPASISVLGFRDHHPRVLLLNHTGEMVLRPA